MIVELFDDYQSEVNDMARLTGKVALVTGASKGIGAAIAKELAAQGASVVVNYASSKEGADKIVAEIKKAGGNAVAVGGSVAKASDIDGIFAETKKAYGKIDILVNNAGVYSFAPLEGVTQESIDWMFDINVAGLLLATKAGVALFPKEGGSVINIGSVASDQTPPMSAVYSATKGAVDAITRVLAKELGPKNIRVNSVNPGPIVTEGFKSSGVEGSDFEKQMLQSTPLGRIGQPDDVSTVVAFLASDEARWITGSLIQVAGGMR
jgi:3-oxoacyl-[acyl-carrier protein] reductase